MEARANKSTFRSSGEMEARVELSIICEICLATTKLQNQECYFLYASKDSLLENKGIFGNKK